MTDRTVAQWDKNEKGAYKAASLNGWLDECCAHMERKQKPAGWWTLERCKDSAANYDTIQEWRNAEVSAYKTAHRRGWLDMCCTHMNTLRNKKK